jgi:hypothetical protein
MNFKHGHKRKNAATSLYRIHHNIVQRCTRPNAPAWKDYGGRGITLHPPWLDFATFLNEIPERPSEKYKLDRIDNDKGYVPGNLKWSSNLEQANNKRNNKCVTINGKTRTVPEWCRIFKRNYWTVKTRIYQAKMDPAEAILKPTTSKHMGKGITYGWDAPH